MAWTQYKSKSVLLDVTVNKINAGATITTPTSSTSSVGGAYGVTVNSILTSALARGYVADALEIDIISPVDSTGGYPDVQIVPINGSKNLQDIMVFDGSVDGNMMPRAKNSAGVKKVILGYSTRNELLKSGGNGKNIAQRITGIKVTNSLSLAVTSQAGWGNSGTATTPLRVIVRGELLDSTDLQEFQNLYRGQVAFKRMGVPAFFADHTISGPITTKTWGELPGGNSQKGVKINRRFAYAYNSQTASVSVQYPFSEQSAFGGNTAFINNQINDLGMDFKASNNAFLYTHLGLRIPSGSSGYFGFKVDGTVVPQDNMAGTPVFAGTNEFEYGSVAPQRSESGLYYQMPTVDNLADMLVYQNSVVPIFTPTGSAISANDMSVAIGGVLIQES